MRELAIMRHAEAVIAPINAEDFQRPLTTAGRSAAAQAAQLLLIDRWAPQRILCSPALRGLQTAEIVLRALALPSSLLQTDRALYLAAPATLCALVSRCDSRIERLLLIGHNPGLSQWLTELSAPDQVALAPAEFQRLALPIAHWSELVPA